MGHLLITLPRLERRAFSNISDVGISVISPSSTGNPGLFSDIVLHTSGLISDAIRMSNPAFSNPRFRPIAPENRDMTVSDTKKTITQKYIYDLCKNVIKVTSGKCFHTIIFIVIVKQ